MYLEASDPLSIVYVDLNTMTATLNAGWSIPITNLFDDAGDECEPNDAVVAVAGSDSLGWWSVDLQWADAEAFN